MSRREKRGAPDGHGSGKGKGMAKELEVVTSSMARDGGPRSEDSNYPTKTE